MKKQRNDEHENLPRATLPMHCTDNETGDCRYCGRPCGWPAGEACPRVLLTAEDVTLLYYLYQHPDIEIIHYVTKKGASSARYRYAQDAYWNSRKNEQLPQLCRAALAHCIDLGLLWELSVTHVRILWRPSPRGITALRHNLGQR